MSYSDDRYAYQSAELSKLDYSGKSHIRVKLTSTPNTPNVTDFPETKWLSLSADTARKVADIIATGAREDAMAVTEPPEPSEEDDGGETPPGEIVGHLGELAEDALFLAASNGVSSLGSREWAYWLERARQTRKFMAGTMSWSQQEEEARVVRRYAG